MPHRRLPFSSGQLLAAVPHYFVEKRSEQVCMESGQGTSTSPRYRPANFFTSST